MSIELKVESYCDDCPEFEPNAEKTEWYMEDFLHKGKDRCDTEVTCIHKCRCESMYRKLKSASRML